MLSSPVDMGTDGSGCQRIWEAGDGRAPTLCTWEPGSFWRRCAGGRGMLTAALGGLGKASPLKEL